MDQQQLTAGRGDLAATGVSLATDVSWQISLSPPTGVISVLLRDQRGYGPIAGEAFQITGPNGVQLNGTTGDDGSIKFDTPPIPIDHYDLAVCDDTFTIVAQDPSFPPLVVRVPSWPEGWTRDVGDQPAPASPNQSAVIVLLMDPSLASFLQDEFILSADDGSYSQSLFTKDNEDQDPSDGKLELHFSGLDPAKTYTLEVRDQDHDLSTIFQGVAYSDLTAAAPSGSSDPSSSDPSQQASGTGT
ncbi:MAG TPA: hypothetical protein VFF73_34145 [Planctomycetota bacterium]|nr:hypothetical protein [Planctomycetota bacterium]